MAVAAGTGPAMADAAQMLTCAPAVLVRGSNHGVIEWISPTVQHVLGWSPDEMVGRPFLQFVHPLDVHHVRATQIAVDELVDSRFEARLRRHNGSYRWMAARVAPLYDRDRVVIGRVAIWDDIQNEVDGRRRHFQQVERLRGVFASILDAAVWCDAIRAVDGTVSDFVVAGANDVAAGFLGRERGEIVGMLVTDLLPQTLAAQFVETHSRVLISGLPFTADALALPSVDRASPRYYDVRSTFVDANAVGVTWREVTDRLSFERTRSELATLKAVSAEKDRVARDLHDGFIQQVLHTGMMLDALRRNVAPEHHGQFERLIVLQEQIVADIRGMLIGLTERAPASATASIRIAQAIADAGELLGEMPTIEGIGSVDSLDDPTLVEHLMYSLREMLSNVVRHAHATRVHVRLDVIDGVSLTVTDDGIGASPVDSPGRGLLNLRGRARQLGGIFSTGTTAGGGTTVTWSVPHRPQD